MSLKKISQKRGFTLIEILVVIGIIAILATIVIVAINPAKQFRQANDTQRTANVNAILNAVGQYIADHKGTLPPPLTNSFTIKPISNATAGDADLCSVLVPTYIPSLVVDPSVTTGPISTCPVSPATYNTKYNIAVDVNGRVTVSADKEEPQPTTPNGISVTR